MRPLLCALGFLTRFPVSLAFNEEELGRSAGYFAWIGALIAALLWVVARMLVPLDARIASLLVVLAWAYVTGGLHLDGVADAVDGWSGGRGQRDRTLEIMRDSRIGSHGALALVFVVLLKWVALERLLPRGDLRWLMAPIGARYLATVLMVLAPYARDRGLGSGFAGRVGARELVLGALAVAFAGLALGLGSLWGLAAGLVCGALVARAFHRLLGGLTGDVYGAALEVCEVTCLLVLALR